ncbi:cytochrome P450 6d3-like [Culicoides brevitarsis]|uniref:cytochrome P450 6d3-like n=1 Tax=Culicoides brevitarsis TaxID=469753 RepID=UPI00307B4D3D
MFLLISLISLPILGFLYIKYLFSYWTRQGFDQIEPEIPYGNMKPFMQNKKAFGVQIWELYNSTKKAFIGIYIMFSPSLLVRDVTLAKKILVEDFNNFTDRGIYMNEKREPLSVSLLSLPGHRWKHLRQKMTPLFSSGKLRNMFPTVMTEVNRLESYMETQSNANSVVDMKDILLNFVLNVVGSIFFGIEVDMITNPDHPFKQTHLEMNDPSFLNKLRGFFSFLAPSLMDLFRLSVFSASVKKFFINITNENVEFREKNNFSRADFLQLMVELRRADAADGKLKFSTTEIASNSILFYMAGTETTSATASTCLYELALHPDLMKRVQTEIDETLAKHEGVISYDSIQEMELLEMCIKETLRKYPGLPMLNRECTKDFKIPDSDLTIKKGTAIVISTMGFHYDPKYFAEPEKFIPERFKKGEETYNKDAYMPFGDGPRQCIAVRMGMVVAKVAVVKLLTKFNFETVDGKPIEFDTHAVGLAYKGGLPLKVHKR